MYQVKLSNQAEKDLKKLDKIYKTKVAKYIGLLTTNPLLGEKMEGQFKGWFRIKIPPLRIIYTQDAEKKIILVRAIGPRGSIYK